MKNISKNNLIISTLIILLLGSIYLNFSTIQQKKKYENYLTQKIANTLRSMVASIETGNDMLGNAINEGSISGGQLIDLFHIFEGFSVSHQDLRNLANSTQDKYISSHPKNTWEFSRYLHQMIIEKGWSTLQVAGAEEEFLLSAEQLIWFRQMQSVTEGYKEIFIDYQDWDYSITNEHWIMLLEKIIDTDERIAY